MSTPCCPSSGGILPKDAQLSNLVVQQRITTCGLAVCRDANIGGNVNVGGNLYVQGLTLRPWYNQIHANSSLTPNEFAVIGLPSQEIAVRQNDGLGNEWNIFGPQIVFQGGPAPYNPPIAPYIEWTNVYIPYTGVYEFRTSGSYIPSIGGIFAGYVDGNIILPGVDFSIAPPPGPFQNEISIPMGAIAAGVHRIGLIWIGNGQNPLNAGNSTYLQFSDGLPHLVQIA